MTATLLFLLWLVLFLLGVVACVILALIAFYIAMLILAPVAAILIACWEAWRGRS